MTTQDLVSYATLACRHRGQKHAVRYLFEDKVGTGDEEHFDDHVAALERFVRLMRAGIDPDSTLRWVKAFPTHPASTVEFCLFWERPKARHVIVSVREQWPRSWWGRRHHTGTRVFCSCGIEEVCRDSDRFYAEMLGEEIIHTGGRG